MKSATLIKIVLGLSLLATLGLIATGSTGSDVAGADLESVRTHVVLGLITILLLTLTHAWILMFLTGTIWAVRSTLTRRDRDASRLVAEARRLRLIVAPWGLLALSLAIVNFLLGARVYASSVYASGHRALFWATLTAQGVSLVVTAMGIRRYDRLIRGVEQAVATGDGDP